MNWRSLLAVSAFCLFSAQSFAAIGAEEAGDDIVEDSELSEYDRQIQVQVRLLDEIDHRIGEQKKDIRKKSRIFYRFKQKPVAGPRYLWIDAETTPEGRDRSLKVLALGLKESVRDLDLLESRRIEAQAELEWTKIQQEEFLKQKPAIDQNSNVRFVCNGLPVSLSSRVSDKVELIQGFGMQKDPETELEWNSLGWWLSTPHEEVVSCAPATVVFVGEISGRGRVVMLDHGAGHLTVYANLNPSTLRSLKKGQKIQAGQSLGMSLDRLYFEYRRQGVATNPKDVLRAESLAKVAL